MENTSKDGDEQHSSSKGDNSSKSTRDFDNSADHNCDSEDASFPRKEEYSLNVQEINSDKFQPSKAFVYDVIDDMHNLVDNNKIDYFQIDSSLDAGTKLYETRIDQVLASTKDLLAKLKKSDDDYFKSKQNEPTKDDQPSETQDD